MRFLKRIYYAIRLGRICKRTLKEHCSSGATWNSAVFNYKFMNLEPSFFLPTRDWFCQESVAVSIQFLKGFTLR